MIVTIKNNRLVLNAKEKVGDTVKIKYRTDRDEQKTADAKILSIHGEIAYVEYDHKFPDGHSVKKTKSVIL